MYIKKVLLLVSILVILSPCSASAEKQEIPDGVYSSLEYALSLVASSKGLDPEEFSGLVQFILETPPGASSSLKERSSASGAFHSFVLNGEFSAILDYVYNPDIPNYVTMPSSLKNHKWLTPDFPGALRNLPRKIETEDDIRLLRGSEQEEITPDTNTGGYYLYNQDRAVVLFPGANGPVFVSASIQNGLSDVGKKGCVVGDDKNWNYLYSGIKGLNKTGIGWVDSFLYQANSVLIYVADSSKNIVHVGSFKWLNAGWAKINMVRSDHILEGIKRFAYDFKSVMEAPGLPHSSVIAKKYKQLMNYSEQNLRKLVGPYLEALMNLDGSAICSRLFRKQLSSGDYLRQMTRDEMVRILLMEYVKGNMGKKRIAPVTSQQSGPEPNTVLN